MILYAIGGDQSSVAMRLCAGLARGKLAILPRSGAASWTKVAPKQPVGSRIPRLEPG